MFFLCFFFPFRIRRRHAFLSTAGKCASWCPTPAFLVCSGSPMEAATSSSHSCWGGDEFAYNKWVKLFTHGRRRANCAGMGRITTAMLLTTQTFALLELLGALTNTGRQKPGRGQASSETLHSISTQIIISLFYSLSFFYPTSSSIRWLFWKVNVNLICFQIDIWPELCSEET